MGLGGSKQFATALACTEFHVPVAVAVELATIGM